MKKNQMAGCAMALCVLLLGVASAPADIIGVDVAGPAYTGPGVLDTSSRTWLSKTGNSTFTLDGQTVTLVFGSNSTGNWDATIDLFDNYKFTTGSAFGVVLTDLDPTKTYNIVYYGLQNTFGNPGRGTTFDLAEPDLMAKTTTGDNDSAFIEGVNYVRWDNLTPQPGDNRIRVLVGIGPDGSAGFINGFEIESIPEPATMTLLTLGLGMGVRRRRRA